MPALTRLYQHFRWLILLSCLLLLSGCFQYDLTLRFDHQLHGQIEQVITLSDRTAAVANGTLAPWVHTLETRTKQQGGTIAKTGYHQRRLTVPFTTPDDLVQQFHQLFADVPPRAEAASTGDLTDLSDAPPFVLTIPDLGQIPFRLAVDQRNWLLVSRTHLTYDIDLGQLPIPPADNSPRSGDRPWTTLGFRLQVPWGIGQVLPTSATPAFTTFNGAQWRLQPGQNYHIEVWFWLPSLVALGAIVISIFVILGYFLRYRVLRRSKPSAAP